MSISPSVIMIPEKIIMTEGLFCSFFTEERMDMKNNITAQIESGYGI